MNDQDTVSRKIMERLLRRNWHIEPGFPKISIGEVPAIVPFDVPLPEDGTLFGGIAQTPYHIFVEIDVACRANEVLDYYRNHFLNAGWSELDEEAFRSRSGFQSHSAKPQQTTLCKASLGPSLTVTAIETDGATQVHLLIECDPHRSRCDPRQRLHRPYDRYDLLPALPAPPEARPTGGGGSGDHTYQQMVTMLDGKALLSHYSRLLEEAGWKKLDEEQTGMIPHTTWQFEADDEMFQAILLVFQMPEITDLATVELHWFTMGARFISGA